MQRSFPTRLFIPASLFVAAAALAAACSANGGGGNTFRGGSGGSAGGGGIAGGGGGIGFDAGGGAGGGTVVVTTCAQAESARSYVGCDFWPTVVANNVWSIFDYAVVVANAGDQPADVTIERGGKPVGNATVAPNSLEKIYLPWVSSLKGPDADNCGTATPLSSTVRANGGAYHLTTTVPVTVYQFNALEYQGKGGPPGKSWRNCPGDQICADFGSSTGCYSFSNDASLLLPSTAMTGNYRVAGTHGWGAASMSAYFAVTATADGTNVDIKVSGTGEVRGGGGVQSASAGQLVSFTLDAGDVVEVVGGSDDDSDLSGSLVQADKPVQVIAGIPCIQQPLGTQACDHIEESVFPIETLGKHYVVTRPTGPYGQPVGQIVRIYGNVDGTLLTYPNGRPNGYPSSIDAGQVIEGPSNEEFEVVGDHEFSVGLFLLGAEQVDPLGSPQQGDPSESLAVAVEQWRTKYVFLAPSDYDSSYVDVVMPVAAHVQIDGADLASAPNPIGGDYGVARVHLGPGNDGAHVLTSDMPVGIQIIGYGQYTTYQYPGGLDLENIAPPPPPLH